MSEHLSQTQLTAYSGRTLPPQELLAVDNHLASCDVCHQRLTRILPADAKIPGSQSFESGEGPFHLNYEQHLEPYVDGKANEIDREIVDSHVALCSKCANDLRDLLAFKAAARCCDHCRFPRHIIAVETMVAPMAALPNPALATAAVIAVFILAMAVLLWTTNPTSRRVEQAETGSPL